MANFSAFRTNILPAGRAGRTQHLIILLSLSLQLLLKLLQSFIVVLNFGDNPQGFFSAAFESIVIFFSWLVVPVLLYLASRFSFRVGIPIILVYFLIHTTINAAFTLYSSVYKQLGGMANALYIILSQFVLPILFILMLGIILPLLKGLFYIKDIDGNSKKRMFLGRTSRPAANTLSKRILLIVITLLLYFFVMVLSEFLLIIFSVTLNGNAAFGGITNTMHIIFADQAADYLCISAVFILFNLADMIIIRKNNVNLIKSA